MPRKPLASARIPQEWMDQIQAICTATGKTPSEVVQDAIATYLNQANLSQVNRVNPSEERVISIEGKLEELIRLTRLTQTEKEIPPQALSQRSTGLTREEGVEVKSADSPSPQRLTRLTGDNWLTTGELYQVLQSKGFRQSVGTLRRWLKGALETGELPSELHQWGVEADINLRRASNPKDNAVRWLRRLTE